MPTIAWRAKPSSSGSVTATTCITPPSISRCTRWRTAASERPTTLPIAAYERRPSCCSCSMIAFETSSSGCGGRPGFLVMAAWFPSAGLWSKVSRGSSTSDFVARMFRIDGIACRGPVMRGTIRGIEQVVRRESHGAGVTGGRTRRTVASRAAQGRRWRRLRRRQHRGAQAAVLRRSTGAKQDPASCAADGPVGQREAADHLQLAGLHRPAKKADVDALRSSRTRPASPSTTPTTSTTTPSSTPRCKNQLGSCEPIKRDMIVLTDWMAARMIGLGWIQPLDKAKVPNLHENLIEPLRDRQWDPDLTYHAPWQSGLTGIAYNAAKTGEVKSFEELLDPHRPQGPGHAALRDARHDGLHAQGRRAPTRATSPTTSGTTRSTGSRQVVATGQIRAFTGNEYIQDLAAGNIVACEAWSGDVIQAPVRQPGHQVRHARGGAVALERQHAGPQPRDPPGQRREVDRLLLRARGRREARRLGQLHLPGRGRPARRWRRSTRRWSTTS